MSACDDTDVYSSQEANPRSPSPSILDGDQHHRHHQPHHSLVTTATRVSTNSRSVSPSSDYGDIVHVASEPNLTAPRYLFTREGAGHSTLFQEANLNDISKLLPSQQGLHDWLASLPPGQIEARHAFVTCSCRSHRSACLHHMGTQKICLSCAINIKCGLSTFPCIFVNCRERMAPCDVVEDHVILQHLNIVNTVYDRELNCFLDVTSVDFPAPLVTKVPGVRLCDITVSVEDTGHFTAQHPCTTPHSKGKQMKAQAPQPPTTTNAGMLQQAVPSVATQQQHIMSTAQDGNLQQAVPSIATQQQQIISAAHGGILQQAAASGLGHQQQIHPAPNVGTQPMGSAGVPMHQHAASTSGGVGGQQPSLSTRHPHSVALPGGHQAPPPLTQQAAAMSTNSTVAQMQQQINALQQQLALANSNQSSFSQGFTFGHPSSFGFGGASARAPILNYGQLHSAGAGPGAFSLSGQSGGGQGCRMAASQLGNPAYTGVAQLQGAASAPQPAQPKPDPDMALDAIRALTGALAGLKTEGSRHTGGRNKISVPALRQNFDKRAYADFLIDVKQYVEIADLPPQLMCYTLRTDCNLPKRISTALTNASTPQECIAILERLGPNQESLAIEDKRTLLHAPPCQTETSGDILRYAESLTHKIRSFYLRHPRCFKHG